MWQLSTASQAPFARPQSQRCRSDSAGPTVSLPSSSICPAGTIGVTAGPPPPATALPGPQTTGTLLFGEDCPAPERRIQIKG